MNTKHVKYNFSYFFHGEVIFNVGFIKFEFKKKNRLKNSLEDFSKYVLKIIHNYTFMEYNKIE